VLDLVATGFDKPAHLFGDTLRTKADVAAVADKFSTRHTKVTHTHECSAQLATVESASDSQPAAYQGFPPTNTQPNTDCCAVLCAAPFSVDPAAGQGRRQQPHTGQDDFTVLPGL
jgi:hypothetical protein